MPLTVLDLQLVCFLADGDRFAEGNYAYRVLDSTAPLEGGYCRCERGPRVR